MKVTEMCKILSHILCNGYKKLSGFKIITGTGGKNRNRIEHTLLSSIPVPFGMGLTVFIAADCVYYCSSFKLS
jgi:hypothetical protein